MEEASAGNAAIEALNGKETDGRTLRVNKLNQKKIDQEIADQEEISKTAKGLKPLFLCQNENSTSRR